MRLRGHKMKLRMAARPPLPVALATAVLIVFLSRSSMNAQVVPVPPRLPTPAPTKSEKNVAEKSEASKTDDAKAASREKNAAKADEKKADPVHPWVEQIRGWSLPGFIAWVRGHGLSVVIIVAFAIAILSIANTTHPRIVRLMAGS